MQLLSHRIFQRSLKKRDFLNRRNRRIIHGTPEIRHFVKSLLNDLHLGRNQLTGAGLFDAMILGWKLYRKFKK